jgi:hypothetical protein
MSDLKHISVGGPQDEVNEQIQIAKNAKIAIIELGILNGETSSKFCEANPNIKVWGIDPLIPDSMNPNLVGDIDALKKVNEKYPNFLYIPDYSYNVAPNWNEVAEKMALLKDQDREPLFDYLFIDASHVYEDVKRDFEDWFALLDQGGIVSLHDSAANRGGPYHWEGPSKLADELIYDPRVEYIKTVYCLTIFKKL